MSDEMIEVSPPYECSLGTVTFYQSCNYIVITPEGKTVGVAANGELSPDNVEYDIANPPVIPPSVLQIWEQWLTGYITDPVTGIELKTSISACNRFSAMETLLRSALEHDMITAESVVTIWDRTNTEHTMTVEDCRGLLLRYGIAWQMGFNELAP